MADTELGLDVGDAGVLHEGHVAVVVELHEAVERAVDAVHPVEGLQLGAEHVGEELELVTHLGRRDREMMDAIRIVHVSLRFSGDCELVLSRPGTLPRPPWSELLVRRCGM